MICPERVWSAVLNLELWVTQQKAFLAWAQVRAVTVLVAVVLYCCGLVPELFPHRRSLLLFPFQVLWDLCHLRLHYSDLWTMLALALFTWSYYRDVVLATAQDRGPPPPPPADADRRHRGPKEHVYGYFDGRHIQYPTASLRNRRVGELMDSKDPHARAAFYWTVRTRYLSQHSCIFRLSPPPA